MTGVGKTKIYALQAGENFPCVCRSRRVALVGSNTKCRFGSPSARPQERPRLLGETVKLLSRGFRRSKRSTRCEGAAGVRSLPPTALPAKGIKSGVRRSRTTRNTMQVGISGRGSTPAAFRHFAPVCDRTGPRLLGAERSGWADEKAGHTLPDCLSTRDGADDFALPRTAAYSSECGSGTRRTARSEPSGNEPLAKISPRSLMFHGESRWIGEGGSIKVLRSTIGLPSST